MKTRGSGILLHISSLPSPFGIGDLGSEAYRFADFLKESGQSIWQILPLNPTDVENYNDPYQSVSTFAGNPLFISPELLIEEGLLSKEDILSPPEFPSDRIDYRAVTKFKMNLLDRAFSNYKQKTNNALEYGFNQFRLKNASWLKDYSLFCALKKKFNGEKWNQWPIPFKDREPSALESASYEHADQIEKIEFQQYLFSIQWEAFHSYCTSNGIQIFGDLAIYVQYDSADVWTNPEIFKLNWDKSQSAMAGVPPDFFSSTGQVWGSPVYNWDNLKKTGYKWWLNRIGRNLEILDLLRIDHFRGLVAYWEIPANESTALNGKWIEAPAMEFLNTITRRFPSLPVIVEDLGHITPDVREVMNHFDFPGMKILLFAFGEGMPDNPYIPHNLKQNCVIYTGTHDNNPVLGWFDEEASEGDKQRLFQYLGREVQREEIPWELIRLAEMSVADLSIIPMQDLLGLGKETRMNRPGHREGNWEWRLKAGNIRPELKDRLMQMAVLYRRL